MEHLSHAKFFYTFNELVSVNVGHAYTTWALPQEKGGMGHGTAAVRRPGRSPGRKLGVMEEAGRQPLCELRLQVSLKLLKTHWSSLLKHKFKQKSIKNFKIVAGQH